MRIVIDMQGAQSESRKRGIGRYTIELTKQICLNRGSHEIILALSGLFADTIDFIRSEFKGILPQENIRVWYAPNNVKYFLPENDWRRKTGELVRESFLASLKPDIVIVSSLFEGLVDDAITSIGLTTTLPTAVILYDLIPLIYQDKFLNDLRIREYYMARINHLKKADLLLAISDSSRKEGIDLLGFSDEKVVNISTASSDIFRPKTIDVISKDEIFQRYQIQKQFIMSAAAIEERKNLHGLIHAYSQLPAALRDQHQLVLTGEVAPHYAEHLRQLARSAGLVDNELILTGHIKDSDLSILYNLCKVFVFSSFHEGFGLPILEAMSCGKAVICSNVSSMPEVIERPDALFDPHSVESISQKINQVLSNDVFRKDLERHALQRAKNFSWDHSAKRALKAIEEYIVTNQKKLPFKIMEKKPRLAYVSPLSPARSGISDYSAELIPALAKFYEIEVIVDQNEVNEPWILSNCKFLSPQWFVENVHEYDRILYHFGNSQFHQHMFALLQNFPGVIVLHDFFFPDLIDHMRNTGFAPHYLVDELYKSHGYKGLKSFFRGSINDNIYNYPCNLSILQNAHGVITHSQYSQDQAKKFYLSNTGITDWEIIPHLRVAVKNSKRLREKARNTLKFNKKDFIVCSFGIITHTKLNHELFDAWCNSKLSEDPHCYLVFVGDASLPCGQELLEKITKCGLNDRVKVTGWVDQTGYRNYLEAADLAVQLRSQSRGETSGAILDCMNYGLPTIINAYGSMAEIPGNAVWKLEENFNTNQLTEALTTIWSNQDIRCRLSKQSREVIEIEHDPHRCAMQYYQAIEKYYDATKTDVNTLITNIAQLEETQENTNLWKPLVEDVARSFELKFSQKQIFLDVSSLVFVDLKTGIQRVVRSIMKEWLDNPPDGYRVEPVYATPNQQYCYARRFTLNFLGYHCDQINDEPIEYRNGDKFIVLDLYQEVAMNHRNFYQNMRNHGVDVRFVLFDLLPLLLGQFFPDFMYEIHSKWFEVAAESDGILCISKAVADDARNVLEAKGEPRQHPCKISWFHLGADIEESAPTMGIPEGSDEILKTFSEKPTFLMVGTVEPRKGHAQTVAAFNSLWEAETDINLVIVGKKGWQVDELVNKIQTQPELGKRLFWLEGISDEYLEKLYAISSCVIAASEGEGFGLPLIEAAKHKIPIIARDIPVFREVAGNHAYYFKGTDSNEMAESINNWLKLYKEGKIPTSENMPWQTWKQSAQQLWNEIIKDDSMEMTDLVKEVA